MLSVWIFACLLVVKSTVVDGLGRVTLLLDSYSNPSHKRNDGYCCEKGLFTNSWCFQSCDNYFKICLKVFGGKEQCYRTKVYHNQDYITFSTRLGNGLQNPISMPFSERYQGQVEVSIDIIDKDQWNSDDFVNGFKERISVTSGPDATTQYTKKMFQNRRSTLKFRLRVLCEENYFGPECTTFCNPVKDEISRYKCDPVSGSKICFSNWGGSNCDEDLNLCRSRPCQNGAKCVTTGSRQYKCQCKFGYSGKNCETVLDPCLHYLNLGRSNGQDGMLPRNETISPNVTIDKAWYRIRGYPKGNLAAGSKPLAACTAPFPIYNTGQVPLVKDGITERQACISSPTDRCLIKMPIKVKACVVGIEKYVVYQLRLPLITGMEYCLE